MTIERDEQPQVTTTGSTATAGTRGVRTAASVQSGATWEEAVEAILATLPLGDAPDLLLAFVDSRFEGYYGPIVERLLAGTEAARLVGCTGQAVIGPALEAEGAASISVLALTLPGAEITTVALVPGRDTDVELARLEAAKAAAWLAFVDPFSVRTELLVEAVTERQPKALLLGGMASSHDQAAGTAVFLDDEAYELGAVLVGLGGAVEVHALVAQGAEPIGQPWTITGCDENRVESIGSRPAMDVLFETLAGLDPATRERAQRNLLIGLAMDEYRDEHGRGDFLIRNLMGADRESGTLTVNALPRLGQTFQFQFRDATAADEDLRARLEAFRAQLAPNQSVLGALLCACNGRGEHLFGAPHHDAQALADVLGPVPTAGLFCNGEIGPVGGKTFLHGFTASIAVLTTRQ